MHLQTSPIMTKGHKKALVRRNFKKSFKRRITFRFRMLNAKLDENNIDFDTERHYTRIMNHLNNRNAQGRYLVTRWFYNEIIDRYGLRENVNVINL